MYYHRRNTVKLFLHFLGIFTGSPITITRIAQTKRPMARTSENEKGASQQRERILHCRPTHSPCQTAGVYELTKKVRATATDETRVGENVKNQPLKTHRQPSEFALLRSRILAKDRRPGTHEGIQCNRAKGIAPSHFTHSNLS